MEMFLRNPRFLGIQAFGMLISFSLWTLDSKSLAVPGREPAGNLGEALPAADAEAADAAAEGQLCQFLPKASVGSRAGLQGILVMEPRRRLSAREMLRMPWFEASASRCCGSSECSIHAF